MLSKPAHTLRPPQAAAKGDTGAVLAACDHVRDHVAPSLGLRIRDAPAGAEAAAAAAGAAQVRGATVGRGASQVGAATGAGEGDDQAARRRAQSEAHKRQMEERARLAEVRPTLGGGGALCWVRRKRCADTCTPGHMGRTLSDPTQAAVPARHAPVLPVRRGRTCTRRPRALLCSLGCSRACRRGRARVLCPGTALTPARHCHVCAHRASAVLCPRLPRMCTWLRGAGRAHPRRRWHGAVQVSA